MCFHEERRLVGSIRRRRLRNRNIMYYWLRFRRNPSYNKMFLFFKRMKKSRKTDLTKEKNHATAKKSFPPFERNIIGIIFLWAVPATSASCSGSSSSFPRCSTRREHKVAFHYYGYYYRYYSGNAGAKREHNQKAYTQHGFYF